MADRARDVEVRINRNTLSIAGQIYQLRTIVRVQCIPIRVQRVRPVLQILGRLLALFAILVILNLAGRASSGGGTPVALVVIDVIGYGLIVIGGPILAVRAILRRRRYLLLLETAGRAVGVLHSAERETVDELVDAIGEALENPPDSTRILHIDNAVLGDVVNGDKIDVFGRDNTGKAVHG